MRKDLPHTRSTWTISEELILERLYDIAEVEKIANFLGRTIQSVYDKANRMGLTSGRDHRKYKHNDKFFSTYTPKSCYWAGFIAADGCIMKIGNTNLLAIAINEGYHLDKFKVDFDSEAKVYKETRGLTYKIACVLTDQTTLDLDKKFNIVPRKTYTLKFPSQIPKAMIKYFIMGFIDGDGCWHRNKSGDKISLNFTSASSDILQGILDWTKEYYGESIKKKTRKVNAYKRDKLYRISICGYIACKMYLDLREEIKETRFERKWDKPDCIEFATDYIKKHEKDIPINKKMV